MRLEAKPVKWRLILQVNAWAGSLYQIDNNGDVHLAELSLFVVTDPSL